MMDPFTHALAYRCSMQVLASALRVLAAMWQHPATAHRAVAVLRASPDMWTSLEACLAPVPPPATAATPLPTIGPEVPPTPGSLYDGGSGGNAVPDEVLSYRMLCEAHALQVLTAEAYARARAGGKGTGSSGGGADAATGNNSRSEGAGVLLDKLVREGTLLRLLLRAGSGSGEAAGAAYSAGGATAPHTGASVGGGGSAAVPHGAVGGARLAAMLGVLQRSAAALYLHLGAELGPELWGGAQQGAGGAGGLGGGEPHSLALAPALREVSNGVGSHADM